MRELALSFTTWSGAQTQVSRLGGKCIFSLSHPSLPIIFFNLCMGDMIHRSKADFSPE